MQQRRGWMVGSILLVFFVALFQDADAKFYRTTSLTSSVVGCPGDGTGSAIKTRRVISKAKATIKSTTPSRSRSCAVIFMLVAASWARAGSRHRIEAAPSGEITP